jgi:hypothetical protein
LVGRNGLKVQAVRSMTLGKQPVFRAAVSCRMSASPLRQRCNQSNDQHCKRH